MNTALARTAATLAAGIWILAGCQSGPSAAGASPGYPGSTYADASPSSGTVADYKLAVARRIAQVSAHKISPGRPQAMLHSVVVIKYSVDGDGRVVASHIERSNHIRANENTAMETLRAAAPLPRPPGHLLRRGRLELYESWLFNNDGRFQLRTIAEPQMDH